MTNIEDYDYPLPKELIAQEPLETRSDARMMVIDRKKNTIDHYHIRDLPEFLNTGDCLVLNNSKVIPAKLVGYRTSTGGRWDGLFLEADENGIGQLLGRTRGKMTPGETLTLRNRNGIDDVQLELIARLSGGVWAVRPVNRENWWELLERVGRVPLPYYIRGGNMSEEDLKNYQTIFAKQPGSVAAPTAGLHFTKDLLLRLNGQGVEIASVTLHVGIGTFRPVEVQQLEDHEMHRERGSVSEEAVKRMERARSEGKRVIAVGTTSVRVLESAAREGVLKPWQGETNLFIKPPYQFKAIDGLLTNFHLPRSTLVVLVRTFGGDELLKRAYAEAVEERYRFFSYGDAMLIL